MPRKLVSFDWAMKKILRQKANFDILESKAKKTLDIMKLKDVDRQIYNRRQENKSLKKSLINSAKIEGRVEGIVEGIIEGEKKAKIEIAKSLLDILDVDIISLKTGLTVLEIEELKE